MTEVDARVLLRDCGGSGGLEAWIVGRRWKAAPGGWTVTGVAWFFNRAWRWPAQSRRQGF
jgi:hypothetical protein